MDLIFCLDNKQGMMFNHRRQSRDKEVIQDILRLTDGHKIWMQPYSAAIFPEKFPQIQIAEFPWNHAMEDEYCYIENADPNTLLDKKVKELIVYFWNRDYPGDLFCTIDFSTFLCADETEFAGFSHEKITRKIFEVKEIDK